jgi:hypothetical protein
VGKFVRSFEAQSRNFRRIGLPRVLILISQDAMAVSSILAQENNAS